MQHHLLVMIFGEHRSVRREPVKFYAGISTAFGESARPCRMVRLSQIKVSVKPDREIARK